MKGKESSLHCVTPLLIVLMTIGFGCTESSPQSKTATTATVGGNYVTDNGQVLPARIITPVTETPAELSGKQPSEMKTAKDHDEAIQPSNGQEPDSALSAFEKNALAQSRGKSVTWSGVVKDGSIQVYSESDCRYVVVPLNEVAMPKEGSKLTVSGTIEQVFQETTFVDAEVRKYVAIRMKNCRIR